MGRKERVRVLRLPEKLLKIRESLNLSQIEIIRKLGFEKIIYQGSISCYESGKREPPLPILFRYAQIAGICVDLLLDDKIDLPEKLPSRPKHQL